MLVDIIVWPRNINLELVLYMYNVMTQWLIPSTDMTLNDLEWSLVLTFDHDIRYFMSLLASVASFWSLEGSQDIH